MEKKETPIPEENLEIEQEAQQPEAAPSELEQVREELAKEHEQYLRLAAEYDNFRKRSQKEKDGLYLIAKADTIGKFLPVFDNLERAADQPTEDEAYKKGVEEFGNVGDSFDPNRHNAVMHIERDDLGESTISQVFQKGFCIGDKVIRFAMVQVAN